MKAKQCFEDALWWRPPETLVVGTQAPKSPTESSPPPLPNGNPLAPGSGPMAPPLPSWSRPDMDGSGSGEGSSGSCVFPKLSSNKFHDVLETLKLRVVIGNIYLEFEQFVHAEEQFNIATAGANAIRLSCTNPDQATLANRVWVNATIGTCKIALLDARASKHHSPSTHDRLCGFCLRQCNLMRSVVVHEEGKGSEDMATVLKLEAEAHAERRNYRAALFCAQKASGIAASRLGVDSEERERLLEIVALYKQKAHELPPSDVSEESLENESY